MRKRMTPRQGWPLLAAAGCIAACVVWLKHTDHGTVTVHFERWEPWKVPPQLVLSVHNGTRHTVSVSSVTVDWSGSSKGPRNITANKSGDHRLSMRWALAVPVLASDADIDAIPPHSDRLLFLQGLRLKETENIVKVYVPPWTAAQAEEARNRDVPNFIARWLPERSPRDARYCNAVSVPKEPPMLGSTPRTWWPDWDHDPVAQHPTE
jgi:hypothetical protein